MHHKTRRLIHHQQVFILIHHINGNLLGSERLTLQRGPHFQCHHVTRLDLERGLGYRLAIERHQPLPQQLLQVATRKLWNQFSQSAIDSLAMQRCANRHRPNLALALSAFHQLGIQRLIQAGHQLRGVDRLGTLHARPQVDGHTLQNVQRGLRPFD